MIAALLLILGALAQDDTTLDHFAGRGARGLVPLVAKPAGHLRVLVGGAVHPGALSAEILDAAGLDAVALGGDELEAAKADPGRLEKLPFVCANVVDAATGKPVIRTHLVVGRVAFVGLTSAARAPAGWKVEDPAAALKGVLAGIAADTVVVLAAMDRLEAGALVKGAGRPVLAIVPARGANSPDALKLGEGWLAQSPDGERVTGRLIRPGRGDVKNAFVEVKVADADFKRLGEMAARLKLGAGAYVSDRKPPGGVEDGPAATFEPGKSRSVWVAASNRALEARVHSFLVTPEFAGRKAAAGRAWLVVDSEWTNQIPMSFVFDRETPVGFQIGDFREILFVVVNGSRLARLDADSISGPGGLTEKEFMLPYVGSYRRGLALFDVPATGIESLDLRFYDFTHGHLAVPMLRKAGAVEPRPISAAKNQILEASVWSVRTDKTGAPEGMTYIRVDVRARSVWPFEVDATAFDLKAKKGAKMKVPSLGRWEDIRRLATLALDGDRSVEPHESSLLADATILLPDASTGDELVFLAPEGAKPRELRLKFERVSVPGRSDPVAPTPLTLPLGP